MNKVLLRGLPVYSLAIVMGLGMLLLGCEPSRLLLTPGAPRMVGASQAIIVATPVGPLSGDVNERLTYSTNVKSNVEGEYTYGFDWGDGNFNWSSSAIASHSWKSSGIYIVRVQARCNEEVSEWSMGKVIMIGSSILSRSPLDNPEQAMKYVTPNADEVKVAVQAIFSAGWKKPYNDFDALREWVATSISYKSDQDNFGVGDYWQFPIETLERGSGDCEDIAILLCSLLRASGVPADQVYVVIGTPKGTVNYHAYLLERYSKGIWSMIEPQLDPVTSAVSFTFLDWALTYDYSSNLYCFNDQYFYRGQPALSSGAYELNIWHSFWPFFPCATAKLERQLETGDRIAGTIEWLGTDKIILDWGLDIYGPAGDIVLSWSGSDMRHGFDFRVPMTGIYRLEIVKKDFAPRNVRLLLNLSGWKNAKN